MSFSVKWEPVSHSSLREAQAKASSVKAFQSPIRTPGKSSGAKNAKPPAVSLRLGGIQRKMVPLGSPMWSPRLVRSDGQGRGDTLKGDFRPRVSAQRVVSVSPVLLLPSCTHQVSAVRHEWIYSTAHLLCRWQVAVDADCERAFACSCPGCRRGRHWSALPS